ncbi:MAG TPA: FG-GAP-like repeat-containing protein [Gaiellales bacterium]
MSRVCARAAAIAAIVLSTFATGASASGTFVQPVHVLHAFHGPTTGKGAYFGWAVSELRDVNGDGVTDVVIGEVDGGPKQQGRVWVYSGRTGHLLFRRSGRPGEQNGYAIGDAGDVNGDGVSDVVSGAPGQANDVGHAYVYSGATGRTIVRLRGHHQGDAFGAAVSSAGDVNGDGVPDLLVGAPGNGTTAGHAYVISGRTFRVIRVLSAHRPGDEFGDGVAHTADLNGDGVPDLIVGASGAKPGHGAVYVYSGRTGRLLFRIRGERGNAAFGQFFVAGVGDVNGDGVPDIYVGDYASSNAGQAGGYAAVYSGVDGARLHAWRGAAGEGLGPGRSAGDVNGDGVPDIIVGAYTSSDGAPAAGKVQIFSGATGKRLRTITSETPNENLGFDAVGIGDTNGNGTPDFLVSAANRDTVYVIDGGPLG